MLQDVNGAEINLFRDRQVVLASNWIIIFKSKWFASSKINNNKSIVEITDTLCLWKKKLFLFAKKNPINDNSLIYPPIFQLYRSTEYGELRKIRMALSEFYKFYTFDMRSSAAIRIMYMRSLRQRGERLRASRDRNSLDPREKSSAARASVIERKIK